MGGNKGFTLIEMVVTIIVMGIIFVGIGSIVAMGGRGYADTVDRQRIQNQARFVIEKLTREVRHAVPNSFSAYTETSGDNCLSFYPIISSGFYAQDDEDRTIEFAVDNQGARMGSNSNRLVINPSQPGDLMSGTQSLSLAGCRDSSNSSCEEAEVSPGVYTYQVADGFTSHSIASRYYIYSDRVAYCIASSGLVTKSVGTNAKITVANNLDYTASLFDYQSATLQRSGLVHLDLKFINGDEESFYKHDVQVLNVP